MEKLAPVIGRKVTRAYAWLREHLPPFAYAVFSSFLADKIVEVGHRVITGW